MGESVMKPEELEAIRLADEQMFGRKKSVAIYRGKEYYCDLHNQAGMLFLHPDRADLRNRI